VLSAPAEWHPSTAPAVLEDLRERLHRTRLAPLAPGIGWSEGIDTDYLAGLLRLWAEFDFAGAEAQMSRHPWREIDVLRSGPAPRVRLRFIHALGDRDGGRMPMPLLLCHGWPDSAWRYDDVVDLLTARDGEDGLSFDVVVPDMPGFGYSPARVHALDSIGVAHAFAALMRDLGYHRYAVAGGDLGSSVARFIALDNPDAVIAVHRMDAGIPVYAGDPAELAPDERAFLQEASSWAAAEGAYAAMHRTKPSTIAAALSDSPAGLAAWVVQKLHAWTDSRGGVAGRIPTSAILTLLTTTWATGSIGPSMRMYRANAAIPAAQHARRVEVPSGFSLFPADLLAPPTSWLERVANVARVRRPAEGGHFAPREVPEIYVREVRDFLRSYR
jgi:pimeloyl-ACP methyl ester carboxylesterase